MPPELGSTKSLTTMRAMKLNKLIVENDYRTIEVHPTPTQKTTKHAIERLAKNTNTPQSMGLESDVRLHALTAHGIDATAAALIACLRMLDPTEAFGGKGKAS